MDVGCCAALWLADPDDRFAFADGFFVDTALLADVLGAAEGDPLDASLAGWAEFEVAAGALAGVSEEDCAGCADCDGVPPEDAGLTVPALAGFVPAGLSAGVCGVDGVALASAGADAGDDVEGPAEASARGAFFDEPVQSASVFTCRGR